MRELCSLVLCRPDLLILHPGFPRGGLPPRFSYPKVASLQKKLGLTLILALSLDSLPVFLFSPKRVLRTPRRRRHYIGAGWVHSFALVSTRVDSGMDVWCGNMHVDCYVRFYMMVVVRSLVFSRCRHPCYSEGRAPSANDSPGPLLCCM